MLPKYRLTVAALPQDARDHLRSRFNLDPERSLYSGLSARGLSQADVVFALLSLRTAAALRGVEDLIGAPIKVLPPAVPPRLPKPVEVRPRTGDARRIVAVGKNPRLPTTDSFQRFRSLRKGMTVTQAIARGVTRKDLRQLVRAGAIEIEAEPS